MLLPAWLAHTIVNDFLIFSIQVGGGGQLGLTGVSESLSSLSCHGVCVCVCVCVCVSLCHSVCASVCDGVCVCAL